MITKFKLLGITEQQVAEGEIVDKLYRVFSYEFEYGYRDFDNVSELLSTYDGVAIQPELFESPATPIQTSLFKGEINEGSSTTQ